MYVAAIYPTILSSILQTRNPSDFGQLVVNVLSRCTRETGKIDQSLLRRCLGLTSSYLLTDTSMNPERGFLTWHTGFSNLVDVLIALHTRDELELETMNEASKACSECWSVAGTWRGLDESRALVRGVAEKLAAKKKAEEERISQLSASEQKKVSRGSPLILGCSFIFDAGSRTGKEARYEEATKSRSQVSIGCVLFLRGGRTTVSQNYI